MCSVCELSLTVSQSLQDWMPAPNVLRFEALHGMATGPCSSSSSRRVTVTTICRRAVRRCTPTAGSPLLLPSLHSSRKQTTIGSTLVTAIIIRCHAVFLFYLILLFFLCCLPSCRESRKSLAALVRPSSKQTTADVSVHSCTVWVVVFINNLMRYGY